MKLSLIDLDALSNALEHSCQGALSPPDRDAALALVAEVRRRRAMPGWCALCRDPLADGHTHTASQWEEAALAQQVQPLTDGDLYGIISDAMCAASVGNNKPEARAIRAAVKALRDRMAQQAQLPYKCEKCGATFENWRCTKCMDRVRAQQAQHDEFDHGFQEGSGAGYAQRLLELLDAQQVQPTCGKPAGELVCNNVAGHAGRCGWTSLREQTQPEHVDGKDCPRCNVVLGRYAQPENVDREMIAEAIAPLFLGPDAYNLKYRLKIADAVLAFFAAHGVKRRGLTP